jgi:transposase-like protein
VGRDGSVAAKIGCTTETLRNWVRQAERDGGQRPGPMSAERERIKALERENRELRQANEILRKASADTVGELGIYAASEAKRDVRVRASGRLAIQAARRSRLMAAAVATFCSAVLTKPR